MLCSLFDYLVNGRQRWPVVEPLPQDVEDFGASGSQYFNIAIGPVFRVAGDSKALGFTTGTVTKPHTLNTTFDRIESCA